MYCGLVTPFIVLVPLYVYVPFESALPAPLTHTLPVGDSPVGVGVGVLVIVGV